MLLESFGKHAVHMLQRGKSVGEIADALVAAGIDRKRASLFSETMQEDLAAKGVLERLRRGPLI
jgi:hypothetical protein